ncbi:MAG: hypothetical protein LBJ18_01120 [Rickettsiales bacterium]|nr:hypothetical protein [Rickettsiales bacterium]
MASILSGRKAAKLPAKTAADHSEDALYREISEEVHAEKTLEFVRKYQKPLIAAAIAAVILVAGVQMFRHFHHQSRIAAAMAYEQAIENMDAPALAALAKNTRGATGDLAAFQSAMLSKDDAVLAELANNGATRDFRDLARIHLAGRSGDKMTATEFYEFMKPVLTSRSPFYYTGMLLVAQKYAAANDAANANIWLDKIINDKNAPASISATAETLK